MKKTFSIFSSKDMLSIDLSGNRLKMAYGKISNIRRDILHVIEHDIRGVSESDISRMIAAYLTKLDARNPIVICPIPNQISMTKNIEVPSRNIKEVEEIINLQAGRHTPFAREEIVVDYVNLGVYKQTYTKILLIIVNREVVTRQLDILSNAKLKVENMVFCPEVFASVYPAVLKMGVSGSPIVLAHIDDEYTNFNVVLKKRILFVRSMPIGAEHFRNDKERSEEKFIEQIRLSMETYQGEDIESVPQKIFLFGATEGVGDIVDKMNSSFHIPSRIVRYYDHLHVSGNLKNTLKEKGDTLSFLNVMAPMISVDELRVNLLPEEIKFRYRLEQRSKYIVRSGIYVITMMILLCSVMVSKIYFRSIYLKRINSRIDAFSPEVNKLERAMTKTRVIKDYLTSRGQILDVIMDVHEILPDNTYLSDIKFLDTGEFSMKGYSDSMSSIFTFVGILEESPYFKDVEAKYTSKRKEKDKDVAVFEIEGALVKGGA